MVRTTEVILVVCWKGRYYVVPRINASTQWCASFASFVVENKKFRWTWNRGAALVRAHNMQRRLQTQYGVREFRLRFSDVSATPCETGRVSVSFPLRSETKDETFQ